MSPTTLNAISADAFYVRAHTDYAPDDDIDPRTGEIRTRRGDPSAATIHPKTWTNPQGQFAVTDSSGRKARNVGYLQVSWRRPKANQRVIAYLAPLDAGTTEADTFASWLKTNASRMPHVTVAVYDGAFRGKHNQVTTRAGIPVINKVQSRNGKPDSANLGPHHFRLNGGLISEQISIVTLDGGAGIVVGFSGGQRWVPLHLVAAEPRKRRMSALYEVPDWSIVPDRLRRAQVRVRLDATDDELALGINRAEHLRLFPPGDPIFQQVYSVRSDTESHHQKLKEHLYGRRLRTCDPERNALDMAIWQLIENSIALDEYRNQRARESEADPPLARAG